MLFWRFALSPGLEGVYLLGTERTFCSRVETLVSAVTQYKINRFAPIQNFPFQVVNTNVNHEESLFPEFRKGSGVYAIVSPISLHTFCHPEGTSDFASKHGVRCKWNFNDCTEFDIPVSNHIDFMSILFQVNQYRPLI